MKFHEKQLLFQITLSKLPILQPSGVENEGAEIPLDRKDKEGL